MIGASRRRTPCCASSDAPNPVSDLLVDARYQSVWSSARTWLVASAIPYDLESTVFPSITTATPSAGVSFASTMRTASESTARAMVDAVGRCARTARLATTDSVKADTMSVVRWVTAFPEWVGVGADCVLWPALTVLRAPGCPGSAPLGAQSHVSVQKLFAAREYRRQIRKTTGVRSRKTTRYARPSETSHCRKDPMADSMQSL